jgi:hypothetical protein
MEKTTQIGLRPKNFEGNCGTCTTSCLVEAGMLLNKFATFYVKRGNENIEFTAFDHSGSLENRSAGWESVHFNVFHVSPTYTFEETVSREAQRDTDSSGFERYPPWCPRAAFGPDRGDPGKDLLLSKVKVFSTYDTYSLGVHCGDLTVQDSGSQFDVRTEDWGQDGISGARSLIDHNIFYLLLKTTCENKGFSANTSNHPHIVSTPVLYGSLTDRNSYIQKEKVSANLYRKTFMYQLGEINKWETCDNCGAVTFSNNCPATLTKYTLGGTPIALNAGGRGNEVFDTEQEAAEALAASGRNQPFGQPAEKRSLMKNFAIGDYISVGCESKLKTWGWVDGGSYYEQVSTAASWDAGCTGPVGEFGDQPDPTLFRCGQRKWQEYGYVRPAIPSMFQPLDPPPAPAYPGCRSQKGRILSANSLVDTNLNQFTLSTPNDLVDLSHCRVIMSWALTDRIPRIGADLVGMAFYSAPMSDVAAAKSHDFNFQEIYRREFSWKNINPPMKPFDIDITGSI